MNQQNDMKTSAITSLPEHESGAEAEHALLAAIVENSNEAIIGRALDGRIISWNAAAERILGYTAAETLGRDLLAIFPPDERSRIVDNRRLTKTGISVPYFEAVRVTKDGRKIDCGVSVSPIRDSQRMVIGTATLLTDITGRKRLEREAHNKELITQLLEALARVANEAGTPAEAMQRCLERICDHGKWPLGCVGTFAPWQSAGVPQTTYWHTEDPERFAEFRRISDETDHIATRGHFVGKVLRERRPVWLSDLLRLAAPGRIGQAAALGLRSAFAFPVIAGPEVVAFLEFFAEDTREPDLILMEAIGTVGAQLARLIERSRAETENARLAAIVRYSNDAIVSRGLDGTIQSWNAAAERMFGWTAEEAIGQSISLIVPPERRGEMRPLLERALRGARAETIESLHRRKDGTRIETSVTFSVLKSPRSDVESVSFIYRDVSEQRRLEREAERKTKLTRLLETLARAANEADTPEAAMRTCLARICEHGSWALGRLGIYGEETDISRFPERTFWHTADAARYEEFMRVSLDSGAYRSQGAFITTVLVNKQPLWASPIVPVNPRGRLATAVRLGLHCVFAFPVAVGDKAAAFLEFYSTDARPIDTLLMESIANIGAQLARLIERERAMTALADSANRLNNVLTQTVQAIVATVEKRDPFTAGHQQRVSQLATAIAQNMGLSPGQIEGVRFGASILDIGKIAIPAEILNRPGKLTRHEVSLTRLHAQAGYEIVKDIEFPWPVAQMILQHHERLDGSGYPGALKGDDILLEARILAVADVVEAMASHRPYRPSLGLEQALAEVSGKRGLLYDAAVVDACLRVFRETNCNVPH
jgi:PAS domain S-box-containing protein